MSQTAQRNAVVSFSEAARLLGTDIRTISGLVTAKGIETVSSTRNHLFRGLSPESLEILRQALEPVSPQRSA